MGRNRATRWVTTASSKEWLSFNKIVIATGKKSSFFKNDVEVNQQGFFLMNLEMRLNLE